MDRQIVYPGQILPETTLLQMAKDAMIGSAKLAAAMLGTSTIANGFAVTPTGPASLQIVVAPGEIYSLANIDSLAFSTLPADTTHSILKQGILLDGVTLSCPAPTTTGQSINYLVQVTYQDQDSTPVLLPYYNSANPGLPYSGMGNNGLTQNTSRKGVAIVQVKAGASAATGSQTTPSPDSGYVGLYVATVAFGQTTITSGNITQYSGAPLLPSGVLQSIQGGNTTYALDTGAVNACAATFFPAITSLVDGLTLRFKAANSNTGASTFSPNGISAAPIVGGNHAALQGGEIAATGDVWVQWNSSIGGGSWVLVESSGGGLQVAPATKSQHAISASQAQAQSVTAFASGGVSTALTLTPVPAITAYAANQRFRVKFGLASTGTDTLNVSGLGAKSIKQYDSSGAKVAAVFAANQLADVEYDGTDWVLLDQLPVTATQRRQGLRGAAINWKASANGISANIVCSADSVVLANTAGDPTVVDSIALTLNTAVAASATVDGMASGAVAANTWYGIYVWTNSTTCVKRITSDSAYTTGLAPTPPAAGFDLWARRSAFRTDGAGIPYKYMQTPEDDYLWQVGVGSNLSTPRLMASGNAGNPNANSWVAVPVAAFVGPTASKIKCFANTSNSGIMVVAPNNAYSSNNAANTDTGSPISIGGQATAFLVSQTFEFVLESANIYWAAASGVPRLWCMGWSEKI